MKYQRDWSSHIPLLIKVLENSTGPVLELGTGLFSTPLLHWLCLDQGRELYSFERIEKYYQWNKTFDVGSHHLIKVENWDDIDLNRHWGLAFVDHEPALQRSKDILKLADKADFIVAHDSNPDASDQYEYDFSQFKYRFDWTKAKPFTTGVSNIYDLNQLYHPIPK